MITNRHGLVRLTSDLLTQSMEDLRLKAEECDDLKSDNALLRVRIRFLECQISKLRRRVLP